MSRIAPDTLWDTETFPVGRVSDKARLTFQIECANILQTSNDPAMRPRQASLVYHLFDPNTPIHLAQAIYKDIFYGVMDQKGKTPLPYARLITSILADAGIEPPTDFLAFPTLLGRAHVQKVRSNGRFSGHEGKLRMIRTMMRVMMPRVIMMRATRKRRRRRRTF